MGVLIAGSLHEDRTSACDTLLEPVCTELPDPIPVHGH